MKDLLIKNTQIIKEDRIIENGCIVIHKGLFDYIGNMTEAIEKEQYNKIIQAEGKLAAPGLVNAHTHSAMVLLRNYANDYPIQKWLFDYIIPTENRLTPRDIYWGAQLAVAEMIKSGTTAFLDMYLYMDEVAKVVAETGIKACLSKDIIMSKVRESEAVIDKNSFKEFYSQWHNYDQRIKINTEIHSVFLYDEKSLREATEVAKEMNTSIHIHILEGTDERNISMEKHGATPLEVCERVGMLDCPVIAAHCVHLDDRDFDILQEKDIIPVHNPSSNMILGSGISPIPKMIQKGITVALGTDGAASNNNLNMLEEMHLSGLIHKGIHQNPELMKPYEVLKMATKNGAAALGFNSGVIKEGMEADLILIDVEKVHIQPLRNPISALTYSVQASDVDTTIVNGKILMENRELKTIDIEKVMNKVKKIQL